MTQNNCYKTEMKSNIFDTYDDNVHNLTGTHVRVIHTLVIPMR